MSLEVALTKLRKRKIRSSKDAFILLMASPCFTTRYITLHTLTRSILPIKTARKELRLSHYTYFDQSKGRTGSRRKIKNITLKLIRRNGKARRMPQVSSHRKGPGSRDRLRAEWVITELGDMSLFLRHPSNDTYSIQPVVQQWVTDTLHPSCLGTVAREWGENPFDTRSWTPLFPLGLVDYIAFLDFTV